MWVLQDLYFFLSSEFTEHTTLNNLSAVKVADIDEKSEFPCLLCKLPIKCILQFLFNIEIKFVTGRSLHIKFLIVIHWLLFSSIYLLNTFATLSKGRNMWKIKLHLKIETKNLEYIRLFLFHQQKCIIWEIRYCQSINILMRRVNRNSQLNQSNRESMKKNGIQVWFGMKKFLHRQSAISRFSGRAEFFQRFY